MPPRLAIKPRHALPIISAQEARRLLLHAQALLGDPVAAPKSRPAGAPPGATVLKLIEQLGFVQIDSINIVERAHHLILASRIDNYRPALLAQLAEQSREVFEHWTHDASAVPTRLFRHWKHRFARYRQRVRSNAWWRQRIGDNPDSIIDQVRQRIERDGPLLSRDFEHVSNGIKPPAEGWWGWKPQKAALEYLWRSGELMIARRVNFQKVYDLAGRVLPEQAAAPPSDETEHVEWACESALARLGAATPGEIAAFWNAIDLRQARTWCDAAARSGRIVPVTVQSADASKSRGGIAFAPADWQQRIADLPQPSDRIRLLAPFDPVLRDRKRALRLFGFDYRFEAFVPADKRRFGYYVMPALEGDRLIGRINPKFHRAAGGCGGGVLEIAGMWWEPKIKPTRARRAALDEALQRLASLIGADTVRVMQK